MDFSYLMELADKNKEDAAKSCQVKRYSTEVSKAKKPPKSNVDNSAIKAFLKKKESDEKKQKEEHKHNKQKLLALRAANPKSSKAAKMMSRRTKDNDFSIIKLTEDEEILKTKVNAEMKRKETLDKLQRMKLRISLEGKGREVLTQTKKHRKNVTKDEITHNIDCTFKNGVSVNREIPARRTEKRISKVDGNAFRNVDIVGTRVKKPEKRKIVSSKSSGAGPLDFNSLLKLAEKLKNKPVELKVENNAVDQRPLSKKQKMEMSDRSHGNVRPDRESSSIKSTMKIKIPKIPSKCKDSTSIKTNGVHKQSSNKVSCQSDKIRTFEKSSVKKFDSNKSSSHIQNKLKKVDSKIDSVPSYNTVKSKNQTDVPQYQTSKHRVNNNINNNNNLPSYSTGEKINENHKMVPRSKSSQTNNNFRKADGCSNQKSLNRPPSPGSRFRQTQRNVMAQKRRIIDSDDEIDEEMDDFIDDGPETNTDYSSHIREIFGYDRRRYKYENDEDIQEASFAEQMREECRSAKIGLMEDLEDIRREAEEKKQKRKKTR